MVGLLLLLIVLGLSYYVLVIGKKRFNLPCKAVAIGSLLQVVSILFVVYSDIRVLGRTTNDWHVFIGLGILNNMFFILGLMNFREKEANDRLSIAPLVLVYFILILIRFLNPISIEEMHTELRLSGAGKIPFIVIQLRVLIPLLTLALYVSFVRVGRVIYGVVFVIFYMIYSFYLGNRGDIFYMLLSILILRIYTGMVFSKKLLYLGGLVVFIGLFLLSNVRAVGDESFITQGLNRLASFRVAGQIIDGSFPPPNKFGLLANLISGVPSSVFDAYRLIGQAFEISPSLGYAAAYFNGYKGSGIAVPIAYEFVWWFNPVVAPIVNFLFGLIIALYLRLLSVFSKTWTLLLTLTFLSGFIGMEDMTTQFWPFFSRYVLIVSISVLLFRSLWAKKSI
jgi:hypothetical protein